MPKDMSTRESSGGSAAYHWSRRLPCRCKLVPILPLNHQKGQDLCIGALRPPASLGSDPVKPFLHCLQQPYQLWRGLPGPHDLYQNREFECTSQGYARYDLYHGTLRAQTWHNTALWGFCNQINIMQLTRAPQTPSRMWPKKQHCSFNSCLGLPRMVRPW